MITPQLNCIMLIDDNKVDNFFHQRVIKKNSAAKNIIIMESAEEALDYLANKPTNGEHLHPDLIFLDINMPGMNGWEFIEEYKTLSPDLQSKMIVVMLTTSENPDDLGIAKTHGVLADFKTKPLTADMLAEIIVRYHEKG